jgi:hypothetical protein
MANNSGVGTDSTHRQGIQLIVPCNIQQHRAKIRRMPLTEDFFESPLGRATTRTLLPFD